MIEFLAVQVRLGKITIEQTGKYREQVQAILGGEANG